MLPPMLQSLRIPVIASPMLIASYPDLVLAQCKAGIVGAFPALNARPPACLADWLAQIDETLAHHRARHPHALVGPYAVNQICHASNARLDADMRVCLDRHVPLLITSLRAPPREIVDEVHRYGGLIIHDVTTVRHAEKAIEAGVDGLILVAAGAGGHAGTLSPFALVGEVRRLFDGFIVLSGAIATGEAIAAALTYYRNAGMRPFLANALGLAGRVYDASGKPDRAAAARLEAAAITASLKATGDSAHMAEA